MVLLPGLCLVHHDAGVGQGDFSQISLRCRPFKHAFCQAGCEVRMGIREQVISYALFISGAKRVKVDMLVFVDTPGE